MLPPKKVTLNLDEMEYQRLQGRLYHGQMTRLMRRLISCINIKLDKDGKQELNAFLEGEGGLILPKRCNKDAQDDNN